MCKINELIEWKDEYLTGSENIDKEHKELFDIAQKANLIYLLEDEEEQATSLSNIIDELYKYTKYHFKNEENYMKSVSFPLYLEHKELHDKLLELLNFISLNISIINIDKSGEELYDFVQKLFVNHILNEDIKLSKYISNNELRLIK